MFTGKSAPENQIYQFIWRYGTSDQFECGEDIADSYIFSFGLDIPFLVKLGPNMKLEIWN